MGRHKTIRIICLIAALVVLGLIAISILSKRFRAEEKLPGKEELVAEATPVPLTPIPIKEQAAKPVTERTPELLPVLPVKTLEIEELNPPKQGGIIAGYVRTDLEEPIKGANLKIEPLLLRIDFKSSETMTNARGHYIFRGIPQGGYQILVTHADYAPAFLPQILLGEKEVKGDVNFVLKPGLSVTGLVVDDKDKPVEDATVHMRMKISGFREQAVHLDPREVKSNATGNFLLENLIPVEVDIFAYKEGYSQSDVFEWDLKAKGLPEEVKLRLEPAVSIQGIVVDEAEEPIENAQVAIHDILGSSYQAKPKIQRLFTDKEGRFLLSGLEKNADCILRFGAEGYAEHSEQVSLKQGDVTELKIVLETACGLSGKVVELESGQAISAVQVTAQLSEGKKSFHKVVKTDEQGHYSFEGIPSGKYNINVFAEGFVPESRENLLIESGEFRTNVDFELYRGMSISGKVIDDLTGEPIVNAAIKLTRFLPVAGYSTPTDEKGRFAFNNLAEGRYYIEEVRAKGYIPYREMEERIPRVTYILKRGENIENIVIKLCQGGVVKGKVTNQENEPVGAALVRLVAWPVGRKWLREEVLSNEDGSFEIAGVPFNLEKLNVNVDAQGYAPKKSEPIEITEASPIAEVDIVLSKGGGISGKVTDSSGRPLEGIELFRERKVGEYFVREDTAFTDSAGRYLFANLGEGSYAIGIRSQDYLPVENKLADVVEGQVSEGIDFVLQKGITIRGRVIDDLGNPLRDVFLEVGDADRSKNGRQQYGECRTNAKGEFQLAGLPVGLPLVIRTTMKIEGGGGTAGLPPLGVVIRTNMKTEARSYGWFLERLFPITITEPRELEFILPINATMTGKVLDSVTRESVDEFTIRGNTGGSGGPWSTLSVSPKCGDEGEFEISSLPEGTYALTIEAPFYETRNVRGVELVSQEVTSLGEILLTPSGLGSLRGKIVAEDDGLPIAGARVRLSQADIEPAFARHGQNSQSDGSFLFENLHPGEYSVEISGDFGYSGKTIDNVIVEKDKTTDLGLIKLAKGIELKGQVLNYDRTPLAGIKIEARGPGYWRNYARTDEKGEFEFKSLSEGEFKVSAYFPGEFFQPPGENEICITKKINIERGKENFVEFVVEKGFTLSGTIHDEQYSPEKTRVVMYRRETGAQPAVYAEVELLKENRYEINHLPPGDYLLRTILYIYETEHEYWNVAKFDRITITGDTEFDVEFERGALEGQMIDKLTGQPIGDLMVILHPETYADFVSQSHRWLSGILGRTDSEGRFKFPGLQQGDYTIKIWEETTYYLKPVGTLHIDKDQIITDYKIELE